MKRGQLPRQVHDRAATETIVTKNGTKTHCHFVGAPPDMGMNIGRTLRCTLHLVSHVWKIGSSDEADKFCSPGRNVRNGMGPESNVEGSGRRIFRRPRAVFGHSPKSRAFGARNANGSETCQPAAQSRL